MEDKQPIDLGHDSDIDQSCKDGRSRTWMILTYNDNGEYDSLMSKLHELDWDFCGRIHDQEAKAHYHIVVLFKNGRKSVDIAKDLDIDTRWLRAWDSKKKAVRYLCHKDNPGKFQYTTDGIFGSLADYATQICSKGDTLSESQSIQEIIQILDDTDTYLTYRDFMRKVCDKGLFATYRRMGILAVRLLDEHNNSVGLKPGFELVRSDEFDEFVKWHNRMKRNGIIDDHLP